MENYMRTHNITGELKGKAIKYLEFTWKSERKNIEKEQNLLEKLPESLKNEILFESNKKSMLHFKILRNNFSEEILNKLSMTLRTVQFHPNELIYSVDSVLNIFLKNFIRKEILKPTTLVFIL